MKIIDYIGRLWNPATVGKGKRQTDSAIQLKQEFATHHVRGLTPPDLADILEQADRGDIIKQSELFLDIEEKDPHIHAELSKRKRTVIGLPFSIIPPANSNSKEKEIAEQIDSLLRSIPDFEDMMYDLLDAIGHGFSCVEIKWGMVDKQWRPVSFSHRPQSWFQVDFETRTEIRLRNNTMDGVELWPLGWIVHKHAAKTGYLTRSGLFRVLAWPWLMKQYSLRDLAEYLEIYGLPVKIGKYPRSAPEEDKDNLFRSLQQLGRSVAGIMPDDFDIEFVKESLGSADPFMSMIQYCDDVISRAILGQTLSSSSSSTGLGSGVADLHGEVRFDLLEADAAQLSNTLTLQLIKPIADLNGWGNGNYRFKFDLTSTEDLASFADSIQKLSAAGLPINTEWVYNKIGMPPPKETDQLLRPAVAANSMAMLASPKVITDDYPTLSTNQLMDGVSPLIDTVLNKVRVILNDSQNLEEFQAKLIDWFPESESLDMAQVLGQAFIANELAGMYEVSTQ